MTDSSTSSHSARTRTSCLIKPGISFIEAKVRGLSRTTKFLQFLQKWLVIAMPYGDLRVTTQIFYNTSCVLICKKHFPDAIFEILIAYAEFSHKLFIIFVPDDIITEI